MHFTPLKATDLGLPLMRPLPTILAYARGASNRDLIPPVLEEEFSAHLECLRNLVDTACLRSGIPRSTCAQVEQSAVDLGRSDPKDLADRVNHLLGHLSRMSGIHRKALRTELNKNLKIYRDIYWARVYTKSIVLVHQEDSAEDVAKLERSLRETCGYRVNMVQEKDLSLKPMTSDFVIFRVSSGPIHQPTLSSARALGVPILILMNLGPKVETADPVMIRTALLYARDGSPVLHRPFTPMRLFSAIDTRYVEHLFQNPAFAGARARGAVA